MAFWPKKSGATSENPFRALNPALFDKGARINRQAAELRRLAAKELTGSDVMAALLTALGNEVAATVLRRNPSYLPDQTLHVIDQLLDAVSSEVGGQPIWQRICQHHLRMMKGQN